MCSILLSVILGRRQQSHQRQPDECQSCSVGRNRDLHWSLMLGDPLR
jgi:hypothetical protein